jgi:hypothetical protein
MKYRNSSNLVNMRMLCMLRLAPVPNDVTATNDLAEGEETDHLGGGNADESQFLVAHVANPIDKRLRRREEVPELGGVAERIDQRLVV